MNKDNQLQHEGRAYLILSIMMLLLSFLIKQSSIMVILFAIGAYILYRLQIKKRQNILQTLSMYLQQLYQGSEQYDIRDYCEGEISVLKSDLYKLMHVLKQQREQLQKDKRFLADALSDISHQIKTPLTSMMVISDVMNDDLPEEKRREFILLFQSQLKRVEWLVSSLLKMSKIDANAVKFHYKAMLLQDIIKESIKPFQITMELQHQTLQVEGDANVDIQADEHWIVEAFSNIIKNSLEHSPQYSCLSIRYEDSPLHTRVWIKDQGCGIVKEDIPHIFERFYKGKHASNDSVGIGLALTRAILTQHSASIQVDSELGKGSIFTITFYK